MTGLAKIYPVVTIKICLEFAKKKMGQSTDKNKLQLSLRHGAHAHDHDLRTVLALELFEASLVPRPFLYGRGERGKGLVNNSTPTRIHGCIPAVSVDEGKRECKVGVSRE